MPNNLKAELRAPWWTRPAIAAAWLAKLVFGYTGNRISRLRETILNKSVVYIEDSPLCEYGVWKVCRAIDNGLKCLDCEQRAVTFHGIATVTHGYCEEHRCCAKCGGKVNAGQTKCKCRRGPTERQDYLAWKRSGPWLARAEMKAAAAETDKGMQKLRAAIDNWNPTDDAERSKPISQ